MTAAIQETPLRPPGGHPPGALPFPPPALDEIAEPTLNKTPASDASGQSLCGVPPDEEILIVYRSRTAWHVLPQSGAFPSAAEAVRGRYVVWPETVLPEVVYVCDLAITVAHRAYPAELYRTHRAAPEYHDYDPRVSVIRAPSAGPCEIPAEEAVIVIARHWDGFYWYSEAFSDLTEREYWDHIALDWIFVLFTDAVPDPPSYEDAACEAWLDADSQLIIWQLGIPSPRDESLMRSLVQDYLRGLRTVPSIRRQ